MLFLNWEVCSSEILIAAVCKSLNKFATTNSGLYPVLIIARYRVTLPNALVNILPDWAPMLLKKRARYSFSSNITFSLPSIKNLNGSPRFLAFHLPLSLPFSFLNSSFNFVNSAIVSACSGLVGSSIIVQRPSVLGSISDS